MRQLQIYIALLFLTAGCTTEADLKSGDPGTLIFQSEYTNHAWGYVHNGWMTDSSGSVKRFLKKAPWIFPDSLGYISEKDMLQNMNVCDSVIAVIDAKEFAGYAEKAITCKDGPMTKARMTMADAGENILAFYLYEPGTKRYKRVILSMVGDWSQENLAPNTEAVIEWMKGIK
jgi:uncharacterized protein YceK